jgi:hypothetical protein
MRIKRKSRASARGDARQVMALEGDVSADEGADDRMMGPGVMPDIRAVADADDLANADEARGGHADDADRSRTNDAHHPVADPHAVRMGRDDPNALREAGAVRDDRLHGIGGGFADRAGGDDEAEGSGDQFETRIIVWSSKVWFRSLKRDWTLRGGG